MFESHARMDKRRVREAPFKSNANLAGSIEYQRVMANACSAYSNTIEYRSASCIQTFSTMGLPISDAMLVFPFQLTR